MEGRREGEGKARIRGEKEVREGEGKQGERVAMARELVGKEHRDKERKRGEGDRRTEKGHRDPKRKMEE